MDPWMPTATQIEVLDQFQQPLNETARSKIKNLSDLKILHHQHKKLGHRLVLAHGVFDLLHLGHLRHLEEAKRMGDILLVSITPDQYVNKGPNRPYFNAGYRAEMLAGLSCVNYVVVNNQKTSTNILEEFEPDVYVKGKDYVDASKDITQKIIEEKNTIESHGGEIRFTSDITFSSSQLINAHLDTQNEALREFLKPRRNEEFRNRIDRHIEDLTKLRILFIGETILDEYKYVTPMNKCSKENIVASLFENSEIFAGGVVAAARTAANFCARADILTAFGEPEFKNQLATSQSESPRNSTIHAVCLRDRPTIQKTRFVHKSYYSKLYEVYNMNDTPLSKNDEYEFHRLIQSLVPNYDLIVVTDFGHGLISQNSRELIRKTSRFLAVNTQTNSGNYGFNLIHKYKNADYFCIDIPEARLALSNKHLSSTEITEHLGHLDFSANQFMVTAGREGCVSFDRKQNTVTCTPAFNTHVIDTIGAGDAFLALTAPLVFLNHPLDEVAIIGNGVGALKVAIPGHQRSVDQVSLRRYLRTLLS